MGPHFSQTLSCPIRVDVFGWEPLVSRGVLAPNRTSCNAVFGCFVPGKLQSIRGPV